MVNLRKAKDEEGRKDIGILSKVINSTRDREFNPKWKRDYPNLEFIEGCVEKEELYVCTEEDNIIS